MEGAGRRLLRNDVGCSFGVFGIYPGDLETIFLESVRNNRMTNDTFTHH